MLCHPAMRFPHLSWRKSAMREIRPLAPKAHLALMSAALLMLSGSAQAGTIVGGSSLLSLSDVTQLETWLGEGPLTLTNAYTKTPGDTSTTFHNAVDGIGRTFAIIEFL